MDTDRFSEQGGGVRVEVYKMEDSESSFDKIDSKPSLVQKKTRHRMVAVADGGTLEKG